MKKTDKKIKIFKVKEDPNTLKKLDDLERMYNADFEERYKARRERTLESEKKLKDFMITY